MYARIMVILLVVCFIAGSFYTGRIYERKDNAEFGVIIAKKNAKKTLELQKANEEIARVYHESSTKSYERESELQNQLKRLHVDQRNAVVSGCDCNVDDDLSARLRIINSSGDCNGLPNPSNPQFIIEDSRGIERYVIKLRGKYCRVARQLSSLIQVVN